MASTSFLDKGSTTKKKLASDNVADTFEAKDGPSVATTIFPQAGFPSLEFWDPGENRAYTPTTNTKTIAPKIK